MRSYNQYGITFKGKHSFKDMGLMIVDKKMTLPAKSPIQKVPAYSNVPIDLTALYNVPLFKDREFEVTFVVVDQERYDKKVVYDTWTRTVNWLQAEPGRDVLVDDIQPEYYYLGEVVSASTWEEFRNYGKLTAKFTCNPFRVTVTSEGDDLWNTFSFIDGVSQYTTYEIDGGKIIRLFNTGIAVAEPIIIVDGNITITSNDISTELVSGMYYPMDLAIPIQIPANSTLSINVGGKGAISFDWHKELI